MKQSCRFFPLAFAVLLVMLATPARASFPGKNGRIAFDFGDIYTMNPDGSDVRQLTNLGPDNFAFYASWSSDGKQLVFNQSNSDNFHAEVWLMDADGKNGRRILSEAKFNDFVPYFSPDNQSVVFARCPINLPDTCGIYQVNVNGGAPTSITKFKLGNTDLFPEYSPDGRTVIFESSGREGIVEAIYRLGPHDKTPRRLTHPALDIGVPDWSPEGLKIAIGTHRQDPQNQEIGVVGVGGGGFSILTHSGVNCCDGPHDGYPSWSPQGDAIVFERDSPDFSIASIYVLTLGSSTPSKLITLSRAVRPNVARARGLHALSKQTRQNLPKQILQGGFSPHWGVAAN